MIHGDRASWSVDRSLAESSFEKPLRSETRLTKIDERRNELQVEEYFRKRIEKRSARLNISNINSRKLQTFRSSRKV
jgi:hypothetical protein